MIRTTGFQGYVRKNGQIGIRNLLLVLPVSQCSNELALRCVSEIKDAFALLTTQPCAHLGEDNIAAMHCLVGLGCNPNAAAVLVLGIGCDALSADVIAKQIAQTGKPVRCITVEEAGDWDTAIQLGRSWLTDQAKIVHKQLRAPADMRSLVLGVKCGGSDTTSALAGNPAIGLVVDRLVEAEGTVIFSETTELIGAEHLLSARATSDDVARGILGAVGRTERRIEATGVDPRGIQPTPGNIAGGLSTLEEKSLGGVRKTGCKPISSVFAWGDHPQSPGLHLMDCPANVPQLILGWAAAGAQLLLFSVGGGLPARIPSLIGTNVGGFPLMPVIKVLSNPQEEKAMPFFDVSAGAILEGRSTLEQASLEIERTIHSTASGAKTYLESYESPAAQIWELLVRGPTI